MSRQITKDKHDLSEAEALYLHARNQLTDEDMEELGFDPKRAIVQPGSEVEAVMHTPHTGDANTKALTQKDLDKNNTIDDDELEEENLTEPQLEDVSEDPPEPVMFDDDDEDDDEVDYDPSDEVEDYNDLKADQLRTEIARRNMERGEEDQLSMDGRKADLVKTLEQDDASRSEG